MADIVSEELLVLIFALFLLYAASKMISSYRFVGFEALRRTKVGEKCRLIDAEGKVFEYNLDIKFSLFLSFFAGVSSGLLGIGGGTLVVPILHFALCFPMHLAVATSVFTMVFTSISGATTHFFLGNVQLDYALILSVGVVLGAQIGAYVAKRVSSKSLRRIFGVVLVLVSLRLILKFLG